MEPGKILLTEEEIAKRVEELAQEISAAFPGGLFLVTVLKGAKPFSDALKRRLSIPFEEETVQVSSYREGTTAGKIAVRKGITADIAGKDILIVEDIIDTGRTAAFLTAYCLQKGAKSVKVCTLLDKQERREVDVAIEYKGFRVPNIFIVGFGLDYQEKYRELPHIAALE